MFIALFTFVSTGMKSHPESTKVQRQACRAVSNICIKNVDLKQEVIVGSIFPSKFQNLMLSYQSIKMITHLYIVDVGTFHTYTA